MQKIGQGSYGDVFKAVHIDKPEYIVAIKKIRKNNLGYVQPTTLREISLLKEFNHTNIIKLIQIINLEHEAM